MRFWILFFGSVVSEAYFSVILLVRGAALQFHLKTPRRLDMQCRHEVRAFKPYNAKLYAAMTDECLGCSRSCLVSTLWWQDSDFKYSPFGFHTWSILEPRPRLPMRYLLQLKCQSHRAQISNRKTTFFVLCVLQCFGACLCLLT